MSGNEHTPEPNTRAATTRDDEFAYQVKKQALGPYVEQIWGWDEDIQLEYHRKEFDPACLRIVTLSGCEIGTLEVVPHDDKIVIGKLYLLPEYRNRGIGTQLINSVLSHARQRHVPVRLQVMKVNPAQQLYERLGFRVTGEVEQYLEMEWNS